MVPEAFLADQREVSAEVTPYSASKASHFGDGLLLLVVPQLHRKPYDHAQLVYSGLVTRSGIHTQPWEFSAS